MRNLSWWKDACSVFVLCAATVRAPAQTFTTLLNFELSDGAGPWYMSLAQGLDGNFYGTTAYGGSRTGCESSRCGTVFRITPGGILTSLHLTPAGGSTPFAGLMLATNGNFYGTAGSGGADDAGAVFEITKSGREVLLYSFCSQANCADGDGPGGKLIQATDGNLYGTTSYGGTNCMSEGGCGTVFRITPAGSLTTIYSFCSQPSCADGVQPVAGLIQGRDGNFYGTTFGGGTGNNEGTVFKITTAGTLTTLHSFDGADGALPAGWLVQGTDGNFYGTTVTGGAENGSTIFKISPAGTLTTIYSFCGQPSCVDGDGVYAGLVQGTDGNFYGTTLGGGANYDGTVFGITPGGSLTTLHAFDFTDGYLPIGGLTQATSGSFYGTTASGGDPMFDGGHGCGTVFSLSTGFGPFVAFVNAAGKVGQTGSILGQGFTGTTVVSFNGIAASFTVKSDTFLEATVPPGATTGYVTVTTPSGTLTSNVPFQVIP